MSFAVSERVYEGFVQLFDDRNPLHTDDAFAISKGFKGKVMHGNILNGFLSHFVGECLPIDNVIIHSQVIHYSNPVYLGDELVFSAEVEDVFESVNAAEIQFSFRKANKVKVAKGRISIGVI
jgi:3-hydroxybutyryl-CoA dehydratase